MAKKQTLRDFTRESPSKEDEKYFDDAAGSPSDIASAILQSINIERVLEECILMRLHRRDDDTIEILSKDNGALGTFFSKIGLGYALGIYDKDVMEYLNVVRRVRNAFAHSRRRIGFGSPPIRSELHSIRDPLKQNVEKFRFISNIRGLTIQADIQSTAPDHKNDMGDPLSLAGRAAYTILCMHLHIFLVKEQSRYMKSMIVAASRE